MVYTDYTRLRPCTDQSSMSTCLDLDSSLKSTFGQVKKKIKWWERLDLPLLPDYGHINSFITVFSLASPSMMVCTLKL